jgi:hypothetical protein
MPKAPLTWRRIMDKLSLADLAAGLDELGDRYQALDVFAEDVAGIDRALRGEVVEKLEPVGGQTEGEQRPLIFSFAHEDKRYRLRIYPAHGVVRVTRERPDIRPEVALSAAIGAVAGGAAGATLGAKSADRELAALAGTILGLLIGTVFGRGVAGPNSPRHVFALRFHPESRTWKAYDGGLLRWMKERLAPPEILEDINPGAVE